MDIKKTIFVVALAALCAAASAQVPGYRNTGYKGSVGLAMVWHGPGIETSHGYMFNPHHYLGIGAQGIFAPPITPFFEEFIEYQVYITKKQNAPFLGLKGGVFQTWGIGEEDSFACSVFAEPRFGWSWAIPAQPIYGLTLSGGALILENRDGSVGVMPSLHLAFEF